MNQTSKFAIEIYHVALVLRESLEYAIRKNEYAKPIYDRNKDMITRLTATNSPFSNLLKQNGENGEKIKNNFVDFIDLLYADEARVIHIEDEKVIVDPAFSTMVLDYVVGLHETVNDILRDFQNQSRQNNTLEPQIEDLLKKDDLYYRSVASLVLTDEIHRLFVEFNKTMKEAQGKENPQSSFVLGEINKVIGFYNFVQKHSNIKDEKFVTAHNNTMHVLQVMAGKETPKEGKDLRQEIMELNAEWKMLVNITGVNWSEVFNKIIAELRQEEAKKAN